MSLGGMSMFKYGPGGRKSPAITISYLLKSDNDNPNRQNIMLRSFWANDRHYRYRLRLDRNEKRPPTRVSKAELGADFGSLRQKTHSDHHEK